MTDEPQAATIPDTIRDIDDALSRGYRMILQSPNGLEDRCINNLAAIAAWNTRTPTPAAPQTGYSWTNSAPQGAQIEMSSNPLHLEWKGSGEAVSKFGTYATRDACWYFNGEYMGKVKGARKEAREAAQQHYDNLQGAPETMLLEKMEKARGGGEVVKLTKSESRLMLDMAIRAVELDVVFDMQWKTQMRGVERWRKDTGETLTLPDTADFTVWMLEKISTSDARIAELEARLKLWEPPTTVETGSLPPTEKKP